MSNIQVFRYEGSNITFSNENGVMVNATEMAKEFGKRPVDWLKTQSAKEFIETLSVVKKITTEELIQIKQGGSNQGTWFHEDVAIEFARWLSPMFAIWCNDRIKDILTGRNAKKELSIEEMTYKVLTHQQQQIIDKDYQIEQLKKENKLLRGNSKLLPNAVKTERSKDSIDYWLENVHIELIPVEENYKGQSLKSIYEQYKVWCGKNGMPVLPIKMVSKRLNQSGYAKFRKSDGIHFTISIHLMPTLIS